MTFFEINPANKEIKIYTDLIKQFFFSDNGINNIIFNIILNEIIITFQESSSIHLEDKLHQLYLKNKVFNYSINHSKKSIELVFNADIGMISEN